MSITEHISQQQVFPVQAVWERYRSNLPRHCIGVARYLQASMMHTLTEKLGHDKLRLNFEPFITLVGDEGARLTDLAEWLAISKQACNQTVNQMQAAGYLGRIPDPADGRAKLVVLTTRGRELIEHGVHLVSEVEQEFAGLIGAEAARQLLALLSQLYVALELPRARIDTVAVENPGALAGVLPRLSDYMMQRLMELTRAKGHPGLKMSFSQVLSLIGPDGGRIQQMARLQEVSKQAIGAVANELESLGYIRRETDPADNRQLLLKLTDRGQQLLTDSVDSVDDLERELLPLMGSEGLSRFKEIVEDLYDSLHLEEEIFSETADAGQLDVQLLARRLKRQLGKDGAGELAQLLLQ